MVKKHEERGKGQGPDEREAALHRHSRGRRGRAPGGRLHHDTLAGVGLLPCWKRQQWAGRLQLVEKLEPDLLLTDIRMPFISGIELARQVREVRPATNIAFLSGHDDFEYAKQAIQYNIISYMLKPLTMEGLGAELQNIRRKIDAQYAMFRRAPRAEGPDVRAAVLMPLVLDDFAESEDLAHAEAYARQCGLLRDRNDRPFYTVMVSTLLDQEGANRTAPAFVARWKGSRRSTCAP